MSSGYRCCSETIADELHRVDWSKEHLPSLRFANPSVPITVAPKETTEDAWKQSPGVLISFSELFGSRFASQADRVLLSQTIPHERPSYL